ncbi:MAG: 2,3-bisphosphoglycerate-independent phosphoglycerate mutase [Bacteroidia bacterium]
MNSTKRVILMILDGWGIGKHDQSDAIHQANTPFMDSLHSSVPHSKLKTFGENVGLPQGQMGNSEVGHMNIGAGRVVWQMLVRINKAFKDETVQELEGFKKLVELAKANPSRKIHLMGLVSKGGVHSSQEHLLELCQLLDRESLSSRSYIHAFTDGRDTDPHSAKDYLNEVVHDHRLGQAQIASVCGRYYAMDRDQRWERTNKAYDLLVNGLGPKYESVEQAVQSSYDDGITDEFIKPRKVITKEGEIAISEDDIVLCFNFRTDRARQITRVLTQENMEEFNMKTQAMHYFTLTNYDKTYEGVNVLFGDQDLKQTLGEVLANKGLKQLRAAETEKYPHVTFFFNGGREESFAGEDRLLVNSPKVATYDLQPEMSAPELKDKLRERIESEKYDFICVNFANPDMVGHTGVFSAIKTACETVDSCVEELVGVGKEHNYSFIIIADHGNADKAINEDGTPNTAHTTNLVPCYIVSDENLNTSDGVLADIAPTVLKMMGVNQPQEMTGQSLV